MPRIGLVLGAGAIVGSAYLEGALAGLADVTGWDPREADLIVGTSVGAGFGATLRAGIDARVNYRRTVGEPVDPELAARIEGLPPLDLPAPESLTVPGGRPHVHRLVPRAFARWPWRLGLVWTGIRPHGVVPTRPIGDRIRAILPTWPERPLWVPTLRTSDGTRVVLGRDDVAGDPDPGTAVEASTAVPGFFAPVSIGGADHVDGAGHSPTNLDLCAGLGLDLVVALSPMSADAEALRWSVSTAARVYHARMLDRESTLVEASATPVVAFAPGTADLDAMGRLSMDPSRRRLVAESARRTVAAAARRAPTAARLRVLGG